MAEPSPGATASESPAEEAEQLVSLAAELAHIGDAVNAATLLSQAVTEEALSTAEAAQVPAAAIAVQRLLHTRLEQVGRVLRGAEDPMTILTPYNATGEPQPGDDANFVLRPWRPAQRAAHHARQQAAAEREEEREKPIPRQED